MTASCSRPVWLSAGRSGTINGVDSVTESTEDGSVAPVTERSADLEAVLLRAVDQARTAIVEHSGDSVGEYLGATFDDSNAATHRFLANMPGYQGWQWAVVVAAHPGADHATISEVVLVPGPTALLAPKWVPWQERLRPGDLGPGDLLAAPVEDPRLVQGFAATGDPELDEVAVELGLGRRRLLSEIGRADAAQRWHDGEFGPGSAMARSTRRVCRDCGFYLPLSGALGLMFGVCSNELSADGHVVDAEYGCGAHSDTPAPAGSGSPLFDPYDDGVVDVVQPPAPSDDEQPAPSDEEQPAPSDDEPPAPSDEEQPAASDEESQADSDEAPPAENSVD
jgi:Protein of unknown function (DUF3027)